MPSMWESLIASLRDLEHPDWRITTLRYALPFFLVSAATFLGWFIPFREGDGAHIFLFLVVIAASAWFGGTTPGWMSVVLSSLAVSFFFLPPIYEFRIDAKDIPWLLAFIACGGIFNAVSLRRHRIENDLRVGRDILDATVQARTVELQRAYESLKLEHSERMRAETARRNAQRELARVSRITTMGVLAASIAHEINQPLAAVIANGNAALNWLKRNPPDLHEVKRSVADLIESAERISAVIIGVRNLVRKGDSVREHVNLNDVVTKTLLIVERDIKARDIGLKVELDPALPILHGNFVELQQVVLNTIVNGIDAMEYILDRPRELIIRSELRDCNEVSLIISDSGKGIAGVDPHQIFASFYSTKPNGIGMGLSISRTIIESHGGRISVASRVPHGATFSIILPIGSDIV